MFSENWDEGRDNTFMILSVQRQGLGILQLALKVYLGSNIDSYTYRQLTLTNIFTKIEANFNIFEAK